MLDSREGSSPAAVPDTVPNKESRDVTELLLGVLRSIEPYEACILEAERDGDFEVAAFLRELRRQDLIRAMAGSLVSLAFTRSWYLARVYRP